MKDKKKVVADVFSVVSSKYDTFLKGITFGRIDSWQKDLLTLMGNVENLLDVGTGTGEVLIKAKSSRLRVGVDISLGMLKKAKSKCKECHFILGDAENLPFKDASFDAVCLSLVYRHLIEREGFLKEAQRVLKVGGKIALLDINRFFLTGILVILMRLIKPLGSLIFGSDRWDFFVHSLENSLSVDQVEKEMGKYGFNKVREERRLLGLVYLLLFEKTSL